MGPSAFLKVPLFLVSFGVGSALAADATVGIPVKSDLVKSACGACHEQDDAGRMTRISYERKTPEAWELTLKRMMRTGRVQLTSRAGQGDHPLSGRRPRARARRGAGRFLSRGEAADPRESGERRGRRDLQPLSSRRMVPEPAANQGGMAAPEGDAPRLLSHHRVPDVSRVAPGRAGRGRRSLVRGPRPRPRPRDLLTKGGASTGFSTGSPRTTRSRPPNGRNIARRRVPATFRESGSSPRISRRRGSSRER